MRDVLRFSVSELGFHGLVIYGGCGLRSAGAPGLESRAFGLGE